MNWMILPLRRYAQFSGRSRRKEYWMYLLFIIIALVVLMMLDSALGLGGKTTSYADAEAMNASAGFNSSGGILTAIFALGTLVPSLAVAVRRLHDVDKSGWWILFGLIPLIGGLYLLYLYVQPGTPGVNRFGPNPVDEGEAVAV